MTIEEIISKVSLIANEENIDIINAYLDIAKNKILLRAFPFQDTSSMEVPEKYHSLWIDATVFLILKRGAEGETTHNENGVNRTWASDDLPVYMLKEIVPQVG